MRNNKLLTKDELKVGMRVKIGIPTWWASRVGEEHKKISWWKAKVVCFNDKSVTVKVYPFWYIGNMFALIDDVKLIKTL